MRVAPVPPVPPDKASLRDFITGLDAAALRALALTFSSIAREAIARAEMLDGRAEAEREARAHLAQLARLPQLVAAEIAEGHAHATACARVAMAAAVPVETVAAHWRTWAHARTAEAMAARRVLILRRALAGMGNAEIAAELGVSRRTVERALTGRKWSRMAAVA